VANVAMGAGVLYPLVPFGCARCRRGHENRSDTFAVPGFLSYLGTLPQGPRLLSYLSPVLPRLGPNELKIAIHGEKSASRGSTTSRQVGLATRAMVGAPKVAEQYKRCKDNAHAHCFGLHAY
jgi:hypothetical protein